MSELPRIKKALDCPNWFTHTHPKFSEDDLPRFQAWIRKMLCTHTQSFCPVCGFGVIWTLKDKEDYKIRVSPYEPRYHLRAISDDDGNLKNSDIQIVLELDGKFYNVCPNTVKIKIAAADKITATIEVDMHDIVIDMSASLHSDSNVVTSGRVKLEAHQSPEIFESQHALNSSSDIDEVTCDGEPIYAQSVLFQASGETGVNSLTVETIDPKEITNG